jgi:CBS domain containing-hemolysin-like protein
MLQLRQTRTVDILTPRTVVCALEKSLSVGEALAELSDVPFTRLPVYESNLDTIIGLALRPRLHDIEREDGEARPLEEFIVDIHRVSGELPVLSLLDLFIKRREHLFVVEDEYGQTAGVVTLEDAVETLLGREIMDESDTVEDMQELARTKYRGRLRESR